VKKLLLKCKEKTEGEHKLIPMKFILPNEMFQFMCRSWENRMRVNRKRGNRGHESIVNKLVVNGKIVFKFVK